MTSNDISCEEIVSHIPTCDLEGWSYAYTWSYGPLKRKGRFQVFEIQTVYSPDFEKAIGERQYLVGDDCTERQAISFIKDKIKEFRKDTEVLGCSAACKAPWVWLDERIAAMFRQKNGNAA